MSDLDLLTVRALEEASFRAWPCLDHIDLSGWLLRFSGGHTRRANSVNVLERSGANVTQRIAEAEECYASRGLPPVFRIIPLAETELDSCLEAQGYERHDPTLTMIGAIPRRVAGHTDVRLSRTLTPAWFDGFCRHSPVAQHHREPLQAIMGHVSGEVIYASIEQEAQPVALGMSVVEGDRAGYFEILVAERLRGRGLGRQIMETLMAWARDDAGAKTAWLQVVKANTPAVSLYRSFSLDAIYSYHYRARPA